LRHNQLRRATHAALLRAMVKKVDEANNIFTKVMPI
jgi:hypothetical protein